MHEKSSKKFSSLQKFLLAIVLFGIIGAATMFIGGVAGSTNIATTILPPRLAAGPGSGLVGHWTFDGEDIASGQVNDRSGNSGHGSQVNMSTSTAYVPGAIGQAIDFDGSNDSVAITDDTTLEPVSTVTYSAWIKTTQTTQGYIYDKETNGPWNGMSVLSGKFRFTLTNTSGITDLDSNGTVNDGVWHHLVAVYNGATMSVYIDGTFDKSTATTGDISYTTDLPRIGSRVGGALNFFDGTLDDIRVYSRALSLDEIKQLYQLGATTKVGTTEIPPRLSTSPDSGLVAHWTFDGKDVPNGLINDKSGQGNNGSERSMSTSTAYSQGIIGQALNFDGVDDIVQFGTSPQLTSTAPFTASFWANIDDYGSSNNIINLKTNVAEGFCVFVMATAGYQGVAFGSPNLWYEGKSTGDISSTFLGNWRHVALRYDGVSASSASSYSMYVDGAPIAIVANSGVGTISNLTALGSCNTATSNFWLDGKLDDVRVYSRALAEDEIKQLYQLGVTTKVGTTQLPPGLAGSSGSGLIGHWTFDGKDVPNGLVRDRSDQGNNGSERSMSTSTAYSQGIIGQALNFDGVDDIVQFGTSPQLTSTAPFTASFWANIDDFGTHNNVINLRTNLGEGFCIFISANSGFQGVSFGSPTLWYEGKTTGDISGTFFNNWRHVALLYDGVSASSASSYSMYVDGAPIAIVANSGVGTISNATALGSCNTATATFWLDGKLDDVRVYNRTLSIDEIKQLYQMGK